MEENLYRRRDFLGNVVKAGAAGILINPLLGSFSAQEPLTVSQVIERIIAQVPGGKMNDTVDTLKSGSGDMVVTGIVTTMFATVEIIHSAAKMKANFIIAHEPTYYNHLDNINWVENNNIVKEKMALLEKYKITIWRFHDYWHSMKPDGILHGVLAKMDWLSYNPKEENVFQVPAQPVLTIFHQLKDSLKIPHVRYVGDLSGMCSIITLLPGAGGGHNQLETFIKSKSDLLIVGECSEWETPEYFRDAIALGKPVSLIVLGHSFSEEPGMEYLVKWLQSRFPAIPVKHIASGEPFTWSC